MPATTVHRALDGLEFYGKTSAAPWGKPPAALHCTRCGSSLAGRREAVKRSTTRGICLVTELFRCRCGRGRRVERQEAAAR